MKIATKQSQFNIISRYYLAGLYTYRQDPISALWLYKEIERKHPYFILINYQKAMIYDKLKLYNLAYMEWIKAERLYPLDKIIQEGKNKYTLRRK